MQFVPDVIVDLEFLCETTEKFEENHYETTRCDDQEQKRVRPASIFNKYKVPTKQPKRKKGQANNPLLYSEEKCAWLANRWYEESNALPTRSQILKGIIQTDKKQMLQLFPKYPADHASMEKVLESRKLAW